MVSEQFDPAMGRRSTSSIKVDQQSMLEIKEINRNISASLKQMMIDLRSVISEINSRNKKIEFVEEELQIVKKELSGDLDEDVDDKQLHRGGSIDHQPDSETILIWKSDPNRSPNPYSDSNPNRGLFPNPNPNTYSGSDQFMKTNPELDLNHESGMAREGGENSDDEDDGEKRMEVRSEQILTQAPLLLPVSQPPPPYPSSSLPSLASLPWWIPWSSLFQSRKEKGGMSTKSVPVTLIWPKPKEVSLFWPMSIIDIKLQPMFMSTTLTSVILWWNDDHWKLPPPLLPPLPWPPPPLPPPLLMSPSPSSKASKVGLHPEPDPDPPDSSSIWNIPKLAEEMRILHDELMYERTGISLPCFVICRLIEDKTKIHSCQGIVDRRLVWSRDRNLRECMEVIVDHLAILRVVVGIRFHDITSIENDDLTERNGGGYSAKDNFSIYGVYVEVVQGGQVSLMSIVGLSTSQRTKLNGVEGIMLSDSGLHMDEVENTCHNCLEKIHQMEAAFNFIVETEDFLWFLVIGEYGCKSNMECIMKAIVLSVYISYRSVMERTLKHLVMQKPSKRVDVDKMDRLVKDVVLLLFGTPRLIDGISFEDQSMCVGRTQTISTVNPVKSSINWKVWWADVYRKFLPPPWPLPPPTPFDIHLIGLLVEARVAWFHCPLLENTKSGAATKQKTSDVLLSTTKEQKAAEFGRSTNKRLQSQKKQVLILLCGYGPWYISWSFHKVAEKKSQKLLDFSKFVGFFKSWLSYGCNGDGEKERQEAEFSLEFLEGISEPKMMQREGPSNRWLEDVHQEPSPPPQPPPLLDVFDIKNLNSLFHFFPP